MSKKSSCLLNYDDLNNLYVSDLKNIVKGCKIKNYSTMRKNQLIKLILSLSDSENSKCIKANYKKINCRISPKYKIIKEPNYNEFYVQDLKTIAKKCEIKNYNKFKKQELVNLIESHPDKNCLIKESKLINRRIKSPVSTIEKHKTSSDFIENLDLDELKLIAKMIDINEYNKMNKTKLINYMTSLTKVGTDLKFEHFSMLNTKDLIKIFNKLFLKGYIDIEDIQFDPIMIPKQIKYMIYDNKSLKYYLNKLLKMYIVDDNNKLYKYLLIYILMISGYPNVIKKHYMKIFLDSKGLYISRMLLEHLGFSKNEILKMEPSDYNKILLNNKNKNLTERWILNEVVSSSFNKSLSQYDTKKLEQLCSKCQNFYVGKNANCDTSDPYIRYLLSQNQNTRSCVVSNLHQK